MTELLDLGGVMAAIDDRQRPGATNAGVIIDDDGLTIVDAGLTPARGAALLAALERLDRPIRRLTLTSSHMAYVGGSGAFRLPAVYGTPQVSAQMDQEPNIAGCQALYPDDAAELAELADAPTRRVTHVIDNAAWITPSAVAAPLSGELDENLIVQVPEQALVFAGAMCSFGVTPMAGLGDPACWADALDTLLEWGEIFVPGHGPIGGREEVLDQQAYLRACVDANGDVSRLGEGPWRSWAASAYHAVNVERAAMLADGDPSPPPSLLALLGQ